MTPRWWPASLVDLHTQLFGCGVHDGFKGLAVGGVPLVFHTSGLTQLCAQVVISLGGVADVSGDLNSVSHNFVPP